jgi:hypothetical protein
LSRIESTVRRPSEQVVENYCGYEDYRAGESHEQLQQNQQAVQKDCLTRPLQFSLPLYRERPRLPFTARIERAQFPRARSASKKGTWPLYPLLAGFFNSLLEKFFHRFRWSGQNHLLTLFDNRTLNEIRMGHHHIKPFIIRKILFR